MKKDWRDQLQPGDKFYISGCPSDWSNSPEETAQIIEITGTIISFKYLTKNSIFVDTKKPYFRSLASPSLRACMRPFSHGSLKERLEKL